MTSFSLNAVLVPFAFAVGSVALGALLALLPGIGARTLGPIQTFAVAAALTVVLVHLIPESADSLGVWALVGFGAGMVAPLFIEGALDWIVRFRAGAKPLDHDTITAEVGFAGLLVHQVGDGFGLWLTSGAADVGLNASFALSAHTVPLATLFVLRLAMLKGRTSALFHAGGLAAASAVGILMGSIVPADVIAPFNPWIEAVVAGLLLHVITHDLHVEQHRTTVVKFFDMAALVFGVGITLLASHQPASGGHEHTSVGREAFLRSLADLSVQSAPVLFAGLAISAAVQATGGTLRSAWIRAGSAASDACRGIAVALRGPASSARVVPVSQSLFAASAGPGLIAAFLVAAPSLGVDALLLMWRFFDARLALARFGAAAVAALLVGVTVAVFARGNGGAPRHESEPVRDASAPPAGVIRRFVHAFDGMLLHAAPWMVLGLMVAAYVQTLIPGEQISALARNGLDVVLVAAAAVPTYVGAASATPLAAVLVSKGVSPGAAFAGLVIGPATNLASIYVIRRMFGARAAWAGLAMLVAVGLGCGFAINAASLDVPSHVAVAHAGTYGIAGLAAAVAMHAFTARSLWQTGLRAWVTSLVGVVHDGGHPSEAHHHAH